MYSFGNRQDFSVVDEPFYAWYLTQTGIDHPGRELTLQSMSSDVEQVKKEVLLGTYPTERVFFKNMAHHIIDTDLAFLENLTNLFLIRNTTQLIRSFAKVMPKPTMRDIGIKREWELYQHLERTGKRPVVLDSGDLLQDPEAMLPKLCEALQIPFDQAMLSWSAGPRKEDGVWAPWWYKNVHQSTGFIQQKTSQSIEPLPKHLQGLDEEASLYYLQLWEKRL